MADEIRNDIVFLDISGTIFKTEISIMETIPNSRLAELTDGLRKVTSNRNQQNQQNNVFYFNRDADSFKHILNAYRDGQLHMSRDICPQQFMKELEFWRIPLKLLAPCCWQTFYGTHDDMEILQALVDRLKKTTNNKVHGHDETLTMFPTIKQSGQTKEQIKQTPNKLWLILEDPTSSLAAKIWLFIYIAVVLINVFIIIIWMQPQFRVNAYLGNKMDYTGYFNMKDWERELIANFLDISDNTILLVLSDPHPVMFTIDITCMVFFILETVIHFCVCPNKVMYIKNPYNILKVLLCMVMLASLSLDLNKKVIDTQTIATVYTTLRSFSVTRLVLIFRLHKLYRGLDIMLLSLKSSLKELCLLAFGFFICVIVYGAMMYSAEIEKENFQTIWVAMWWAVITMTTVGYGDFHPTTELGYIIGTACALNGLIVLALPVAAVASNFAAFYTKNADLEKHEAAVKDQDSRSLDNAAINNESTTEIQEL